MTKTKKLQQEMEAVWTVGDVAERFRVTTMTIHNWREHRGLPALVIPGNGRPALRFIPHDVEVWAKANDVQIFGSEKPNG